MTRNKYHCSVPGCDRMGPYKFYCTMHYQRMKKNGDPGPVESERVYGEPITAKCEVDGCEKTVRSRHSPYCEAHYYRICRNGTLDTVAQRVPDSTCTVEGCDRIAYRTDGHCRIHFLRMQRNGDYLNHAKGELSPKWLADNETNYWAVHQRMRKKKGRAADHQCADCGGRARHWSYNHQDPDEKWSEYHGYMMPYSLDPDFYEPRCAKCHKVLDMKAVTERREEADAS